MNDSLRTTTDLAERLRLPVATTEKLRRREGWPHIRLGRAIRFTEDHIAQIVASHTVTETPAAKPIFEGQRRSGRRSA